MVYFFALLSTSRVAVYYERHLNLNFGLNGGLVLDGLQRSKDCWASHRHACLAHIKYSYLSSHPLLFSCFLVKLAGLLVLMTVHVSLADLQ